MSKLQKIGFNYLGYGNLPAYEIIDDVRKGYLCVQYLNTASEWPQDVKFISFTQVTDLQPSDPETTEGQAKAQSASKEKK